MTQIRSVHLLLELLHPTVSIQLRQKAEVEVIIALVRASLNKEVRALILLREVVAVAVLLLAVLPAAAAVPVAVAAVVATAAEVVVAAIVDKQLVYGIKIIKGQAAPLSI